MKILQYPRDFFWNIFYLLFILNILEIYVGWMFSNMLFEFSFVKMNLRIYVLCTTGMLSLKLFIFRLMKLIRKVLALDIKMWPCLIFGMGKFSRNCFSYKIRNVSRSTYFSLALNALPRFFPSLYCQNSL